MAALLGECNHGGALSKLMQPARTCRRSQPFRACFSHMRWDFTVPSSSRHRQCCKPRYTRCRRMPCQSASLDIPATSDDLQGQQRAHWAASVRAVTGRRKHQVWEPELDPPPLLAQVCVVLVNPKRPVSVGTVARALSCFECTDLRVVQPRCNPLQRSGRNASKGAQYILYRSQNFDSLSEAVADCQLSVAFARWSPTASSLLRLSNLTELTSHPVMTMLTHPHAHHAAMHTASDSAQQAADSAQQVFSSAQQEPSLAQQESSSAQPTYRSLQQISSSAQQAYSLARQESSSAQQESSSAQQAYSSAAEESTSAHAPSSPPTPAPPLARAAHPEAAPPSSNSEGVTCSTPSSTHFTKNSSYSSSSSSSSSSNSGSSSSNGGQSFVGSPGTHFTSSSSSSSSNSGSSSSNGGQPFVGPPSSSDAHSSGGRRDAGGQNGRVRVALVFGREEAGLLDEELLGCDAVCTIPIGRLQESLSLSHAVTLALSHLFSHVKQSLPLELQPLYEAQSTEGLARGWQDKGVER